MDKTLIPGMAVPDARTAQPVTQRRSTARNFRGLSCVARAGAGVESPRHLTQTTRRKRPHTASHGSGHPLYQGRAQKPLGELPGQSTKLGRLQFTSVFQRYASKAWPVTGRALPESKPRARYADGERSASVRYGPATASATVLDPCLLLQPGAASSAIAVKCKHESIAHA